MAEMTAMDAARTFGSAVSAAKIALRAGTTFAFNLTSYGPRSSTMLMVRYPEFGYVSILSSLNVT